MAVSCNPVNDVIKNYSEKEKVIVKLADYYKSIFPKDNKVYIRFNSDNNIDLMVNQNDYWNKDSWNINYLFDQYGSFNRWDINLDNKEAKEIFDFIGWNKENIEQIRYYLKEANCISIGNGFKMIDSNNVKFISIGYPTYDLYGLSYILFDKPLDEINYHELSNECSLKGINKKVFVEYGGPAFGSDCFPDKK